MQYKGAVLETLNEKAEKRAIYCRILKTNSYYNYNVWERNFVGRLGRWSWKHTIAINLWKIWGESAEEQQSKVVSVVAGLPLLMYLSLEQASWCN